MKQGTPTRFEDLPYDILKHIMLLLAMSEDGPKNIATVTSLSKCLNEFGNDEDILKSLDFENNWDLCLHPSFWKITGLYAKSFKVAEFVNNQIFCGTTKDVIQESINYAVEKSVDVATKSQVYSEVITRANSRPHTRLMSRLDTEYRECLGESRIELFVAIQRTKLMIYIFSPPSGCACRWLNSFP